jgi:superfamily I DNA/RNA helicase
LQDLDSLLERLNEPQREAVCQTEGPLLVLAGAGSGKTRVITTRAAYLIKTGRAKASEILAVTFTNKAAEEMRERLGKIVGKKVAEKAVVSTFHSFCLTILREHIQHLGYRKDFTISGDGDTRAIVRRLLDDMDGVKDTFKPDLFLSAIGSMKNSDDTTGKGATVSENDETAQKYEKWLPAMYESYQSALRAANTVDFDDLLLLTLKLWREHEEIRRSVSDRFRYVMVDEFQDTNRVQFALLRELVKDHENFCVVGDDDQSIYAWRGADPRNILELERDFPKLSLVKLEENYRSTGTILDAANGVIKNNTVRREKTLWSRKRRGRSIDLLQVADEEHEAKMAVAWMKAIQGKSGAKWRDFAILYRSNLQSRNLEVAFRQAEVPYVVVGGQEFYERAEVKDVVAYLKVMANPWDEGALLRIINTPRRGIGDTTLHRIHEQCASRKVPFVKAMSDQLKNGTVSKDAARGISAMSGLVREFRRRFRDKGTPMATTAEAMMDAVGYREELMRTSKTPGQFEVRWNNVEAVFQSILTYEKEAKAPTLLEFLDKSALLTDSDRGFKQKRREAAVTLMTIHSAKGLEFPFVFVIGMEDGLLPHDRSLKMGDEEEERRLFYVAITRAMRHLTLFQAHARSRFGKSRATVASRFLKEIPEGLVKERILAAGSESAESEPDPAAGKTKGGRAGKKLRKKGSSLRRAKGV